MVEILPLLGTCGAGGNASGLWTREQCCLHTSDGDTTAIVFRWGGEGRFTIEIEIYCRAFVHGAALSADRYQARLAESDLT
jgi:hypothetical protein